MGTLKNRSKNNKNKENTPSVRKYSAYPPNSHVRKYSAYPQNLCTVLAQIFTNVESFTAEMHKIISNLTAAVNYDNLVDNFIFAVLTPTAPI